jgi:hypothetical protein
MNYFRTGLFLIILCFASTVCFLCFFIIIVIYMVITFFVQTPFRCPSLSHSPFLFSIKTSFSSILVIEFFFSFIFFCFSSLSLSLSLSDFFSVNFLLFQYSVCFMLKSPILLSILLILNSSERFWEIPFLRDEVLLFQRKLEFLFSSKKGLFFM